MNLETINAVAQLVAAIGVILSLFYLAAQIRQNTRSMRAVMSTPSPNRWLIWFGLWPRMQR